MKAVLYARVSSEKQAEKDLSISAQLKALRKYAENNGYEVVREFVDEAESARTANRPSFQEMIALARLKTKVFDAILVWKLSRFARNREDSIVYKSLLRKRGIQVISINEKVDDSPTGRLLEAMIESMDEFYSANLSQEARRGMREAVSRGFCAGGTTPIGYELVEVDDGRAKRRTLGLDKDWAPVVKMIFDLYSGGKGAKEIAGHLRRSNIRTKSGADWTKATVIYVLKNAVYTGDFIWPKSNRLRRNESQVVLKDHHPAIVSRQVFEQVQDRLAERSFASIHPRRINSSYLLSGLLFCAKCGKAMQGGAAKSGRYHYYACYSRSRISNSVCECQPISTPKIETAIIGKLQTHVLTEENLIELLRLTNEEIGRMTSDSDTRITALQRQLNEKERRLERIYDAIEAGHITGTDISPRVDRLKAEADEIRMEISRLECNRQLANRSVSINMAQLKGYVAELRTILLEGEYFEQKTFLKSFIRRIDLDYPKVNIQYTFPLNKVNGERGEVLAMDKNGGPNLTLPKLL